MNTLMPVRTQLTSSAARGPLLTAKMAVMEQRSCQQGRAFDKKAAPQLPSLKAHAPLHAQQQTFWVTVRKSLSSDRFLLTSEMGFAALRHLTGES